AGALAVASGNDACAHGGRRFRDRIAGQFVVDERRQLNVEIDTVKQRPRQAAEVPSALGRCAQTAVERRTAAAARVGGRYELKTGREIGEAAGARDAHTAVLERLAQRLEDMLLKFRELIEKQDATMRERDFTGMRRRAASDQTRDRDGVVRSAER